MRFFKIVIVFFLINFCTDCIAQDIKYAREVIDNLCSPEMHGRGYVLEGETKAAVFIAEEFKRWGLKPFEDNYYQDFIVSVNTFPEDMLLSVNGVELEAGKDFIVSPSAKGQSGSFKTVHLKDSKIMNRNTFSKLMLNKSYTDKVLVFDYDAKNAVKARERAKLFIGSHLDAGAFISVEEKLTWHTASSVDNFTHIQISRAAMPSKIKEVGINIDASFQTDYQTQNVVGYIKGTRYPDSMYVFTAHYDHLGRLGAEQYIPGANDNASGVAMLLNLAKHYSENPPEHSIAFIAFGAEELGLIGSKHFVENPLFPLEEIKFLVNLDIVGTGDEGITVVNANEFPDAFARMEAANEKKDYLPQIKKRGEAANSDHWFFYQNDVPCFFIFSLVGIQAYHDVFDRPETLPLTEFEDLMRLLVDFCE
ncbi:MAG: M28 family metallopeptidase [Chitinophagales bacterium]